MKLDTDREVSGGQTVGEGDNVTTVNRQGENAKNIDLMNKILLPKGSVVFEQVLLEIAREKEAAEHPVEQKVEENTPRQKASFLKGGGKGAKANALWKLVSMRTRTKSQRDLLSDTKMKVK